VYLPDAMPAAWYDHVAPLVQALHADEAARATCTPEDLPAADAAHTTARTALEEILPAAIAKCREFLDKITLELVLTGMVELLEP
jgi:propanediol dehydratase small subunit